MSTQSGLRFPDRPAGTLGELQRDVMQLFYQLGAGAVGQLHRDVEISSAGTKFAHGLRGGVVPRSFLVLPKEFTEGPPYQYANADGKLIYVRAVPTTVYGIVIAGAGVGGQVMEAADVGDVVASVLDVTDGSEHGVDFETTITVDNEIRQTSTDITAGDVCMVILKRPVTIVCDILVLP